MSHCTSVPHDVPAGDGLYSLFFSVSAGVEQGDGRSREMLDAERHRASPGLRHRFAVGDRVWARWYPCSALGSSRWRRATGWVTEVDHAGSVSVAWERERGQYTVFGRAYLGRRLVHAGLVGAPLSPGLGQALVGCRVRVFWAGMDRLYPGTVQAFDSTTGQHTVAYDDGERVEGTLGGTEGDFPYVFKHS